MICNALDLGQVPDVRPHSKTLIPAGQLLLVYDKLIIQY